MAIAEEPSQHYQSFLATTERKLVRAIIADLPDTVAPRQLTVVGLFGAGMTAIALIGCRWSPLWLLVVVTGVFLNWFGMSLDGPLARLRQDEQPNFALLDHVADLFSLILIIVAFGLSPFLSYKAAFIVLFCYLFFSAYTYMRVVAKRIQQMAYIGLGITEFRLLMIVWPLVAQVIGVDETAVEGLSKLDLIIMLLAAFAFCDLVVKIVLDGRKIAAEEQGGQP